MIRFFYVLCLLLRHLSKLLLIIGLLCFQGAVSYAEDALNTDKNALKGGLVQPEISPWGFDLEGMQKNTAPGDNFYEFANGSWQNEASIAPNYWSQTPTRRLAVRSEQENLALIADLDAQDWPEESDEAKFLGIYASYMDRKRVNRLALEPIAPFLQSISRARTHNDMAERLGSIRLDVGGLFDLKSRIDPASGEGYIPSLEVSDLLLGARENYIRDDAAMIARRAEAKALLQVLLRRTGQFRRLEGRVDDVIALETQIASLYKSPEDARDPDIDNIYMSMAELRAYVPDFGWDVYFEKAGILRAEHIHIRVHQNLPALVALFRATPVRIWKDYMRLRLMDTYGLYLTDSIAEDTAKLGAVRRGTIYQARSAAYNASRLANQLMPDVLGRAFAEEHFDDALKASVLEMSEAIRQAYRTRISNAVWLSPETKVRALVKLDAVKFLVGRPEGWNDYSSYAPNRKTLFNNVYWARQLRKESSLRSLLKPKDAPRSNLETLRSHVFFSPRQIGAYYLPRLNAVIIPAGYMQAPYYDPGADMAVNYGALGTTIGHELGHAFDDQGSKYDWDGQLVDWWLAEDRSRFDALGAKLAAQFDTYEAAPGVPLNSQLTLGENISDLAGLEVAYHAYEAVRARRGQAQYDAKEGARRFLLGYAQKRRALRLPSKELELSLSDPHSPPIHRVNGSLRNFDVWYDAFDVTDQHNLWLAPEARVQIW